MLSRLFIRARALHAPVKGLHRSLLSEAYYCKPEWEKRLTFSGFNTVGASDLGLQILQKISSNQAVSSLDYDIFVNKLHELDITFLNFIERVIESYNTTQTALQIVDSSPHAIVRNYIDFREETRLLSLIQNRGATGVFLDEVSANLLMDRFAKLDDWVPSTAVSWELCLQSYFSSGANINPLTFALSLYSCIQLITSTYVDTKETVPDDDNSDDSVQYEFVKYVRNPNYDNFFDISRPRLKLGFLLLHLSCALDKHSALRALFEPTVGPSLSLILKIFGWIISEQPQHALDGLQIYANDIDAKPRLNRSAFERLLQINATCLTRADETSLKRGEPPLPTVGEVQSVSTVIQNLLTADSFGDEDIFDKLRNILKGEIFDNTEFMTVEIGRVIDLYKQFDEMRQLEWAQNLASARRELTLKSIRSRLRALLDEEERLTCFANQAEVERSAWLAPRTKAESQWSRLKEWRAELIAYQAKLRGETSA